MADTRERAGQGANLTLSFDEPEALSDPFAESEAAAAASPKPRSRGRRRTPSTPPPEEAPDDLEDDGSTYTFRWDVEVPLEERRCGAKFLKQWKRILTVQKLGPLVSARLAPREARFQLCVPGDVPLAFIEERQTEIAEQIGQMRRSQSDELPIAGEPAGTHPAGWQGVRVWMTFARRDVETALAKKSKV